MSILQLDKTLLKKELNSGSVSCLIRSFDSDYALNNEDIYQLLIKLIELVKNREYIHIDRNVYTIETLTDYFSYICLDLLKYLDKYDIEINQKILILIVYLTVKLTKICSHAYLFIETSLQIIDGFENHNNTINRYIQSEDYRGLLFWVCSLVDISLYDELNKILEYEYSPPKVSAKWVEKFRTDNDPIEFWFYNSNYGKGLFLILYTPKCRYSKCAFCSLPSLSSDNDIKSQKEIYSQVDQTIKCLISTQEKNELKEVILSNNGNLFDIKTMPTLSLLYTVDNLLSNLPNLQKIILESRVEYLESSKLKLLQETINTYQTNLELEVAIGFEMFNDKYRNEYYKKGLSFTKVENAIDLLSKYNISLKFYIMFHSIPGATLNESIEDINKCEKYFSNLANKYNSKINLHISPTYIATGTKLEKDYNKGIYQPPNTQDIEKMYNKLKLYSNLSYFISLNDEGLSKYNITDNYSEYLDLKSKINKFNITNIK